MSEELNEALKAVEAEAAYEDIKKYGTTASPEGWSPGVNWTGTEGEIVTGPLKEIDVESGDQPAVGNWDTHLLKYKLDPAKFEVVEDTVRYTAWDGWTRDAPGEDAYMTILYSFRAVIRPKSKATIDKDWAEVFDSIKTTKSTAPRVGSKKNETTFVIALADWQVGNTDGGGVETQLAAIKDLTWKLPDAIADARSVGYNVTEILLAGMGDLIEGCGDHYDTQTFTVELNRRDQNKIVRRGIRDAIIAIHPHAPKITVTAVGGNHGENRKNKKLYTNKADNDDVAVFETIAEAFAMNPSFKNISWKLPVDHMAVSHQVGQQIVSFTHGHIAQTRGAAAQTMWQWWVNQAHGRHFQGVADSHVLVSGHWHHLNVKKQEGRVLYICPSLTKVSEYFGDRTGIRSSTGTLTFVMNDEVGTDLDRIV